MYNYIQPDSEESTTELSLQLVCYYMNQSNRLDYNMHTSCTCRPNFLSQWSYLKSEEKELPCHDLTRNDIPDINLQK